MKDIVRKISNNLGFEIRRINPKKTSQSNQEELIIPTEVKFQHKPLKYYETPIGNYYLPADATKDVIASHMRQGKIFEPAIVNVAKQYIKKGSIVLDVGSNFGQMSLIFSQLVGEEGQVFSFEAVKIFLINM